MLWLVGKYITNNFTKTKWLGWYFLLDLQESHDSGALCPCCTFLTLILWFGLLITLHIDVPLKNFGENHSELIKQELSPDTCQFQDSMIIAAGRDEISCDLHP